MAGSRSQSENIRVSVTVPTWLNAVMVRRSGRQVHLTGTLDDDHGAGPVARATIGVYREVSGIWQWVGSAKTGAGGGFSFSLTGRPRGYYEARYADGAMPGGTVIGRYLPVSGKRISFS